MKYIIDLPEEFAEATKEYWNKTVGTQLEPYIEPDRKAIEDAQEKHGNWHRLSFVHQTVMSEAYKSIARKFLELIRGKSEAFSPTILIKKLKLNMKHGGSRRMNFMWAMK